MRCSSPSSSARKVFAAMAFHAAAGWLLVQVAAVLADCRSRCCRPGSTHHETRAPFCSIGSLIRVFMVGWTLPAVLRA